jgi:hypothetical protein
VTVVHAITAPATISIGVGALLVPPTDSGSSLMKLNSRMFTVVVIDPCHTPDARTDLIIGAAASV